MQSADSNDSTGLHHRANRAAGIVAAVSHGDAEVDYLVHRATALQLVTHDVVRLDIAVDQSTAMHRLHTVKASHCDPQRLNLQQRARGPKLAAEEMERASCCRGNCLDRVSTDGVKSLQWGFVNAQSNEARHAATLHLTQLYPGTPPFA